MPPAFSSVRSHSVATAVAVAAISRPQCLSTHHDKRKSQDSVHSRNNKSIAWSLQALFGVGSMRSQGSSPAGLFFIMLCTGEDGALAGLACWLADWLLLVAFSGIFGGPMAANVSDPGVDDSVAPVFPCLLLTRAAGPPLSLSSPSFACFVPVTVERSISVSPFNGDTWLRVSSSSIGNDSNSDQGNAAFAASLTVANSASTHSSGLVN